jgi:hypothetical protein
MALAPNTQSFITWRHTASAVEHGPGTLSSGFALIWANGKLHLMTELVLQQVTT